MTNWLTELPQCFVMAVQMLLTGAVYTQSLKRRSHFPLRCAGGIGLFLGLSAFGYGMQRGPGMFLMPLLNYLFFALLLVFLFASNGKKLCFVYLVIVATQHVAVSLTDTLRGVFCIAQDAPLWHLTSALSFLLVLADCILYAAPQLRQIIEIKLQPRRLLMTAFGLFVLVYLLRVPSFTQILALPPNNILGITLYLYDLVANLATLLLLFCGNREDTLAEENRLIEQLLHERESQERLTGETIELLNMKYHDMKHLLSTLRRDSQREETLEELERELPRYDLVLHTGNKALDTVLGNKLALCQGKDIRLTCMADGGGLRFLSPVDLYALFGNLLDNAIEAVQQEPEERRDISLTASMKRGYYCIHVENYCSTPPALENGLPRTRKQDGRFHGFGMKSIRYIAEKYGGNMTVTSQGQQFCVDLLFPLKQEH